MGSGSSEKLELKVPKLSVNDYIKVQQREFRSFYSDLIEDFAFLSNIRFYLAISLFLSNLSNYTRTNDILSMTVNIPSILMLVAYPSLRKRNIIPPGYGTTWCFLFLLALSLQWSFSFWIFARNDITRLSPTVPAIVLSILWMFALGPHPVRNILKASVASAIFILSMFMISPAYATNMRGGLVVGLLLGFGMRKSLDQMLRFRFFIGEQNKLLELKNAKIDSIFKAAPVGMLIIDGKQTVGADLSPSVQDILGTDIRAGMPFRQILDSSLASDADKQSTLSALEAILGESLLNYELNRDLLLPRLHLNRNSEVRTLKLSYSPLLDSKQIVREILVICDDVTDSDSQAHDHQIARMEGATLLEFVRIGKDQAMTYLKSCREFLESLEQRDAAADDPEKSARLLRVLHTLKGNSRTLGFKDLAEVMHELESDIIAKCQLRYGNGQTKAELIRAVIEFLVDFSQGYQWKAHGGNTVSLRRFCHDLIVSTASAACPLAGRMEPDVFIEIKDPELDNPSIREVAFKILPHLVNNAIDHGLENRAQRLASGKSEKGQIKLTLSQINDVCVWRFQDDGRGLDLEALRKKIGKDSQALSDDDVAQHVFSRGLTTAACVTPLSGRGVGLEAVAEVIRSMGGVYRVCLLPQAGSCHPFYFEFSIPSGLSRSNVERLDHIA